MFLVQGTASQETAKKALPVAGADAIAFPFATERKLKNNFAPFQPSFIKVGSPTINANYSSFKGLQDYLQTEIEDVAEFTLFVVCRSSDAMNSTATRPLFFGNYQSVPKDGSSSEVTYGVGLFSMSANQISIAAGRGNSVADDASSNVTVSCDSSQFQLFCIKVSQPRTEIVNVTASEVVGSNFALPRYLAAGKMRIGSGITAFGGTNDVAAIVRFPRLLINTDINKVSDFVRSYLSGYGISV